MMRAGFNTCFRLLLRNIPNHTPKHNLEYRYQDYKVSCMYGSKFTASAFEIESFFSLVLEVYTRNLLRNDCFIRVVLLTECFSRGWGGMKSNYGLVEWLAANDGMYNKIARSLHTLASHYGCRTQIENTYIPSCTMYCKLKMLFS